MMNLGYSGPVGHPISVSFPVLLIHPPRHPLPPTPYPILALATPPSCPFVTVLGGARHRLGDVPSHFLHKTNEKTCPEMCLSKSELLRLPLDRFCLLMSLTEK